MELWLKLNSCLMSDLKIGKVVPVPHISHQNQIEMVVQTECVSVPETNPQNGMVQVLIKKYGLEYFLRRRKKF